LKINKILLYHRLNLGDLVLASPGIQWLKERYPDSSIRLITNDFSANVARLIPEIDHIYDYRKFSNTSPSEISQLWKARLWNPNLVFGVSNNFDRRLALRFLAFGKIKKQNYSNAPYHIAEQIAYGFGWRKQFILQPAKLLKPILEKKYDLIFFISARKPSNRLTNKQILDVIKKLYSIYPNIKIGIYGTPNEPSSLAHKSDLDIKAELKAELEKYNLSINTPKIEEMIFALASSSSLIAPDGGIAHISAGFNIPVVVLSGNVDIKAWGPYSNYAKSLQTESQKVIDIEPGEIVLTWKSLIDEKKLLFMH
jgi:ADP-heptose:LPS heptosyltransferase